MISTTPRSPRPERNDPSLQDHRCGSQAQTVIAAAILRQLHAVITTGQAWDPHIATHGANGRRQVALAA
jgi:hypothetical protein